MRIGVIPHKSPAHRQTCLTLYRHLLKRTLLLPPHLSKPLLDIITQRFHLDCTITSPSVITSTLSTARSALTLIHSATTNNDPSSLSLTNLATLLQKIQSRALSTHTTLHHQHTLRRPTSPHKLPRIAHRNGTTTRLWHKRIPNSPPIFSRPVVQEDLPNPDRPRRVPYLVNAQGTPFLRYKSGPQSRLLSHVLQSRYKQGVNRWDLHERLVDGVGHGALEDNWDALVFRHTGVRDDEEVDGRGQEAQASQAVIRRKGGEAVVEFERLKGAKSWTAETREALRTVDGVITRMMTERARVTKRMKRIMEGERMLAAREKEEWREVRRARWLADQRKRKSPDGVVEGERQRKTTTTNDEENIPIKIRRETFDASRRTIGSAEQNGRRALSNDTVDTTRKKVVRRPWDPSWIPKRRRDLP